jgi:hypothetical protein
MISHGSADLLRKGKFVPKKAPLSMAPEAAEALAIQALTFIAGDSERLGRFLATTGIGPAEIREVAREPGFLAGVMDHLASDERLLLAFCSETGVSPADFAKAHAALGGHWERETP